MLVNRFRSRFSDSKAGNDEGNVDRESGPLIEFERKSISLQFDYLIILFNV